LFLHFPACLSVKNYDIFCHAGDEPSCYLLFLLLLHIQAKIFPLFLAPVFSSLTTVFLFFKHCFFLHRSSHGLFAAVKFLSSRKLWLKYYKTPQEHPGPNQNLLIVRIDFGSIADAVPGE